MLYANTLPDLESFYECLGIRGVQPFGISGPHWKKSYLGPHIKYTNTKKTDEQKKRFT